MFTIAMIEHLYSNADGVIWCDIWLRISNSINSSIFELQIPLYLSQR